MIELSSGWSVVASRGIGGPRTSRGGATRELVERTECEVRQ